MRTRSPEEADAPTRRLLEWVQASPLPPITALTPKAARVAYEEGLRKTDFDPLPLPRIEDREIPGPAGPLRIRIYRPLVAAHLPVAVFYHGGGFVIGSLSSHDRLCRQLAAAAGCLVVSVGYRLAPEHPYPAAVEDAIAALDWITDDADALGADRKHLAVAGDSAGGTLAALAARHARARGLPLALQVLLYPALDQAGDTPSRRRYADVFPIDRATIAWFNRHTFGHDRPVLEVDASPGRAEDLEGLAPALIVTAGLDPLLDEAAVYAGRLKAAGVPVRYRCFAGTIHGFLGMGKALPAAAEAVELVGRELRQAFRDPAPATGVHAAKLG